MGGTLVGVSKLEAEVLWVKLNKKSYWVNKEREVLMGELYEAEVLLGEQEGEVPLGDPVGEVPQVKNFK